MWSQPFISQETGQIYNKTIQICNVLVAAVAETLQKSIKTLHICNVLAAAVAETLQKSIKTSQICNVLVAAEAETIQESIKTSQFCNVTPALVSETIQESIKTIQICNKTIQIYKEVHIIMLRINEKVEERLQYLKKQRDLISKELDKMPEGNIVVAPGSTDNSYRYYLRNKSQEKLGIYLDKSKCKEKEIYSIKKYKCALVKNIDDEIKKLEKVLKLQIEDSIVKTFIEIHPGIRRFINPLAIDDETYVRQWESKTYQGLGFDQNDTTSFYSDKNERLRSKSEVLIANTLIKWNVPYRYECPIARNNGERLYPDFTILDINNKKVKYWEHLGRMSDAAYVMKNIWKLDEYKKSGIYLGINLFVTYENSTNALGTDEIENTLRAILG